MSIWDSRIIGLSGGIKVGPLSALLIHLVIHFENIPLRHKLNYNQKVSREGWERLEWEERQHLDESRWKVLPFVWLTSRSVLFEISKKPFAVNFILVVISCKENLSACLNKARSLQKSLVRLCSGKAMPLYSLVAQLQEWKIPIKEIKGCKQSSSAAEKEKSSLRVRINIETSVYCYTRTRSMLKNDWITLMYTQ